MILNISNQKPPNVYDGQFHSKFAWWPTRIDDNRVAWLEKVNRRYVILDEGTWAGGYKYCWEYYTYKGVWRGKVRGD